MKPDPKEFRVLVRIQNNRLLRLREDLRLSATSLAAAVGISYQKYLDLESLRSMPVNRKTGDWTPTARKLAAFHGVGLDYLWPPAVRSVTRHETARELAAIEILYLLQPTNPEQLTQRAEHAEAVREAVAELLPAERAVLSQRASGATLEEIGRRTGLGRERVRSVEMRALDDVRKGLKRRGVSLP